jgi:hypothetical protein
MTRARIVLVLFIVYCGDLVWKLANWHEMSAGLQWYIIALALTIRFAVMAGLLWLYIKLKKSPQQSI